MTKLTISAYTMSDMTFIIPRYHLPVGQRSGFERHSRGARVRSIKSLLRTPGTLAGLTNIDSRWKFNIAVQKSILDDTNNG